MLTGKPVRVVWSREEEFFYDTFRPAAVLKIRSGLDAVRRRSSLWDYRVYRRRRARRRALLRHPAPPDARLRQRGAAAGVAGYHPFAVGPWRAPGASTNAFARESHIDVMAAKAGIDPVEFRLKNLTDARMMRVLKAAAKKFGWTPKAAPSGRGVGVACGIDAGTYVALMAEVAVDKATGARAGEARRLRAGHGRGRQPRGRAAADGRLHHDGPRLHAQRGGALQGRRGARHELRHVRAAALLVGAAASRRCSSTRRTFRRRAAASRPSCRWARWWPTRSSMPSGHGCSSCR